MQLSEIDFKYTPLSKITTNPRNPKAHDVEAIDRSIQRFGYVAPIIIDTNTGYLVSGHGRVETLLQMKSAGKPAPARVQVVDEEWLIPAVYVHIKSEEEALAYTIADNRLTQLGDWNQEALVNVLHDIANHTDLFSATGFNNDDLDAMIYNLERQDVEAKILEGYGEIEDDEDVKPYTIRIKCNKKVWDAWEAHSSRYSTPQDALAFLLNISE